ncbi:SLBB domain-containing protein [Algibacillus agarilyticus]|uniref:SLBB domain-containing protein n=1 Tax=Algibacillus agarilyticus TaxID=2234133 RepID=UPI000DD064F4|nr:SLBB domain-containing protein [Algibacillus agarilyticus]
MKLFGFFFLLISFSLLAVTPSQEQIAQFKQLPKAQQKILASQYGVDLNQLDSVSSSTQKIDNPAVVTDRAVDDVVMTKIDSGLASATNLESDGDAENKGVSTRILKPFGYELFAASPSTFAPTSDVPVPHEYVLGPGDTLKVQLFGKEYKSYNVSIDRNGTFILPETGPLQVVGMSFGEFKAFLNEQIEQKVIGAKANITMGEMRSIRIFVLGEAYKPGAYTVSSLSSITHALFVSGGVTEVGSLRNIQLKRKGKVVTTFDLYDLLLKGDTSNDTKLLPGDVVFIPPVGDTVGIDGEIKRPAIYELRKSESTKDLVELAGGYLPTAYAQASKLERIDHNGERTVFDLNLTLDKNLNQPLSNGDVLRVYSVLEQQENVVSLKGHVYRPGAFKWKKGIKVSDLINDIKQLKAEPDLVYSIIVREEQPLRTIKALQFSIGNVLENPNSKDNITLHPRDAVYLFAANQGRELGGLISRLNSQSRATLAPKVVSIAGHVEFPGRYPLTEKMTVKQLVQAAYDYKLDTDLQYALLQKRTRNPKRTWFEGVDLTKEADLNTLLDSEDRLYVFASGEARQNTINALAPALLELNQQARNNEPPAVVEIVGNVKFPARYPLQSNMMVKDLLKAAYDFKLDTDLNYMLLKRFDMNFNRFEFETLSINNLDDLNFKLRARDKLYVFSINVARTELLSDLISQISQQTNKENQQKLVTINGEVRFPGTYPLSNNMVLADIIDAAGGYTEASYLNDVNVNRFKTNLQDSSDFELLDIALDQKNLTSFELQPRDVVKIKRIPDWRDHETVTLLGEFNFPGIYPINKGETLAQLIDRAGGFSEEAFINAAVFTRQQLKASQQVLLDKAASSLKREIISAQINGGSDSNSETVLALLTQLEGVEASGRLVVNSEQLLGMEDSLALQDGDTLIIPRINQAVSVIGEVYAPTALMYSDSLDMQDYVDAAGGYNQIAEDDDTYIIKANGRIVSQASWFVGSLDIAPGDTIVVPTNVDPIPALTIWKEVTSIIYQSTVAIAAVSAL